MSIKQTNLGITGVYILTCDQCNRPAPEEFFDYREIAAFQKRTGWDKVKSGQGLQLDVCPDCSAQAAPCEAAVQAVSPYAFALSGIRE